MGITGNEKKVLITHNSKSEALELFLGIESLLREVVYKSSLYIKSKRMTKIHTGEVLDTVYHR